MKEHPILFNAEMVRAVLDGRKTQTRRLIKPQLRELPNGFVTPLPYHVPRSKKEHTEYCQLGQIGDRLYVREAWRVDSFGLYNINKYGAHIDYRASHHHRMFVDLDYSYQEKLDMWYEKHDGDRYSPSIHMPKWASRIKLEITDIRIERVQDISTKDILAEGIEQRFPKVNDKFTPGILKGAFIELWNSTTDKNEYVWRANPWVWVVEFKKC